MMAEVPEARKKVGVEDFEFGKVLGEGAFGDVLLCIEKATGRQFAAKKIEKKHLIKTDNTKYAVLEREVLVACKHPNIIKLFFSFRDPGSLYYILELAPNGELRKYIKQHGNFNVPVTQFYTAEIVSALEHLHVKQNILHRDLKPENLLLSETMHIKLTDFGTAKKLKEGETRVRTHSFLGTAEYISPECLDTENAEVSRSSDLWALGCIIYQMLAGKPPFHGSTQFLTFDLVNAGQVPWPPHFPRIAKDLIQRLLVKDPNQRLGATDYQELKNHLFFEGINWDTLSETTPPSISGVPEYCHEGAFDKTPWAKFVPDDEQVLEYGPVNLRKETGEGYRGVLVLTNTHFRLINSSFTRLKKAIIINPKSKILAQDNGVDFGLQNGNDEVWHFTDISELDVNRWRRTLRGVKRTLKRRI